MGGIDWGDAPTWAAGAFAAGAAYYARGTLKSQQKQIREQQQFIAEQSMNLALEREELRQASVERRERQARLVHVEEGYGERNLGFLENGSDAPIYDLVIQFGNEVPATGAPIIGNRRITYGPTSQLAAGLLPRAVFGAGEALTFDLKHEAGKRLITFRDDAGVNWSISQHGKLEEVSQGSGTP
ncbi:hypothetical protein QFZ24_003275 [Streptomyces phaeochromogenes]|uniref:hypothetical protein n=1 Tax=Streptomyces phaeochromogenes TaxID=1923 RepID=UPI00278E8E34|nr:hypothetical protein [Streptomyces phaeochromogenes]MDQ0949352.1 hypothetical protein [Streptomyces phaeochromogenes]